MESIYERIRAAVQPDGALPKDFSIQEKPQDPQAIRFAEGAADGIAFYHMGGGGDQALLERLEDVTRLAAGGADYETAEPQLSACFGEREAMLGCIDGLQSWIVEHREELDASLLFGFANVVLRHSASLGAVKYALSVLELLAASQGQWRQTVRTLALSDELTLYCVWIAKHWENSGEELFHMARKVRGWGRVHAVRELEPATREMRDWLLDEGWDNDILPAYTALACAQRGGLRRRLEKETLSRARLTAASGLIRGLLDEGPCQNISLMEDREELLLAYLAQVERAEPASEDLKTLRQIASAAMADELDLPQVRERALALFDAQPSRNAVARAMERGEDFALAAALGMDWQEPLLAALERDFAKAHGELNLLLTPEQEPWVDRALAVCGKNLPRTLAAGPENWSFPPPEEPRYHWLIYTIQFLKPFPGRGLELVLTALESPVVNNRNMALNVLDSWRESGWTLTEGAVQALERLKRSEVNDKLRERLEKEWS